MSDNEFKGLITSCAGQFEKYADIHRQQIASDADSSGITLASHDDAGKAHISEALADGVWVAEFPTTPEAPNEAPNETVAVNSKVLMRAPNVVRCMGDRGSLRAGLKADVVRVRHADDGVPTVKAVWREGQRVA